MNLPNLLTVSRLAAIPVLMGLVAWHFPYHDQVAAGVFLTASLTDTLDGTIARRRGQVTELGKFLDPLADKLFILSVLIVLVQAGRLAAWVVVVIFAREMAITILRSLSASHGHVIAATPFGKSKTVTQVGAVLLLLLDGAYPVLVLPALVATWVAVLFTLWSGADYIWRFRDVLLRAETAIENRAADGERLVTEVAGALAGRGLSVAVAESCTGGLLGSLISAAPGSEAWFAGGVVAYADAAKTSALGVAPEVIAAHGAVSAEVAGAMAEGVRRELGVDLAVAITGIAGPGGGSEGRPVGLTYVSVAGPARTETRRFAFAGGRADNRGSAAAEALRLLAAEARSLS